jgi:hypothetical protein
MVNLSLLVSAIPGAKDLTQHALAAEMPVKAQDTAWLNANGAGPKMSRFRNERFMNP